jgi:hypothetical protein
VAVVAVATMVQVAQVALVVYFFITMYRSLK